MHEARLERFCPHLPRRAPRLTLRRVQACISQDLARRAAEAAEPIYGTNNSLVVALLRFEQSLALYNQWMTETTAEGADPRNVDKVLAMARAVDAFEDKVLPILQVRLSAHTLLPGACRQEEVDTS